MGPGNIFWRCCKQHANVFVGYLIENLPSTFTLWVCSINCENHSVGSNSISQTHGFGRVPTAPICPMISIRLLNLGGEHSDCDFRGRKDWFWLQGFPDASQSQVTAYAQSHHLVWVNQWRDLFCPCWLVESFCGCACFRLAKGRWMTWIHWFSPMVM